jgi:hypothetical protein
VETECFAFPISLVPVTQVWRRVLSGRIGRHRSTTALFKIMIEYFERQTANHFWLDIAKDGKRVGNICQAELGRFFEISVLGDPFILEGYTTLELAKEVVENAFRKQERGVFNAVVHIGKGDVEGNWVNLSIVTPDHQEHEIMIPKSEFKLGNYRIPVEYSVHPACCEHPNGCPEETSTERILREHNNA